MTNPAKDSALDRARKVEKVFHEAADLGDEEQRAFVEAQLGNEPALAAEVLALLAADASPGGLLDGGPGKAAGAVLERDVRPPENLGAYRVEGVLGRGGMATVYRAVHEDVGRPVAVKVLADATLSEERAARFRREQRLHAVLEHPSIARLYDVDVLPDGTPYFVLEMVEGLPLDRWCAIHRPGLEERLDLFREVCEAVSAAHRRAVIHRDLKPSNVLVGEDPETGRPAVKLLDFGIAKSLDEIQEGPEVTRLGPGPMTPAYAAPEQHRGDPLGVYTDVYALGVVLYELLCGERPYDLAGLAPAEAEARVSRGGAEPPSLRTRRNEGWGLPPEVVGKHDWADLDLICGTALDPEPQGRYGSVEALIRDLDHFRHREPLEARPASPWHRLRKFVARHRAAALLTVVAVLVLVAFSVVVAVQAARIAAERDRAGREARASERVATFLSDLLSAATPMRSLGEELTVLSLLDEARAEISDQLHEESSVRARLLHVMGTAYFRLGRYEPALHLLEEAVELRNRDLGPNHPDTLVSRSVLATVVTERGEPAKAVPELQEVFALQERKLGPEASETLATASRLGAALIRVGRPAEAIPVLEGALAGRRQELAEGDLDLIAIFGNLASALRSAGRYSESDGVRLEALAIAREHLPPKHPHLLSILVNHGLSLMLQERFVEAAPFFQEAYEGSLEVLGEQHDNTLRSLVGLALVDQGVGRLEEAAEHFEAILAIQRQTLGERHTETISTRYNLASVYADQGLYEKAEPIYRRTLSDLRETQPPTHPFIGLALSALGALHRETGKLVLAEEEFLEADSVLSALGPEHPYLLANLREHLELLRRQGRDEEAARLEERLPGES